MSASTTWLLSVDEMIAMLCVESSMKATSDAGLSAVAKPVGSEPQDVDAAPFAPALRTVTEVPSSPRISV